MKGIYIDGFDPSYNLAVEEVLFDSLDEDNNAYFLLWQNAPSVIVGRHQNTAEEVNEEYVREHNIPVVRRGTGGGAVYHDLGNLNFSFLTYLEKGEDTSFARYIKPIVEALQHIGIQAEISGRNDMTVAGKKFSGNAQRKSGHKLLQHGTIMINLDVSHLTDILTGNPDKYQSKGISSHKSRVGNLIEFMSHNTTEELIAEDVMKSIKNTLMSHCATENMELPAYVHTEALELADKKYRTWEWNFGKSPAYAVKFRKRFTWGALDFCADIKHGKIEKCCFYGDFFVNSDITVLENTLIGTQFKVDSIRECLVVAEAEKLFIGVQENDLLDFFAENILA